MGNGRGRGDKELGIRLMERDVGGVSAGYRDEQPREDGVGNGNGTVRQEELFNYDMSRRDSDALGSLAGSPTEERHGKGGGGNAFREELDRQNREWL